MQDTVFGFMNDRVHRVADDTKYRGEQGQMPPCGGNCSSLEYDKYRDKLADNDQQVQILWNAELGLQSRLTCDVRQWRDSEIPFFWMAECKWAVRFKSSFTQRRALESLIGACK